MVETEDRVAFYQVLIAVEQEPNKLRQVFEDLDESELKPKLVIPYKKGTSLICGNEVIPVSQIRKIHIVRTTHRNEVEREDLHSKSVREIDRLNRESSGVVFISPGFGYDPVDILEAGEDVTRKFITGHPGAAAGLPPLARFAGNPWLVTVVGGLVVAYLIWKFGWNK
ncbi:hypothetical protein CO610_08240 [Lysobacteraceae bacterium NML95-0200]|nr:hypothetical protein CO610_08240 [Xanthomonadaceae bacterium NML95-0200]